MQRSVRPTSPTEATRATSGAQTRGWRQRGRHRLAMSLAAALAVTLLAIQLPAPVAIEAANGLDLTATSTFTVNPEGGRLDITVQVQMRNTPPNSGGTQYYYNAAFIYLESGATNVRAIADSGSASASRSQSGSGYDLWKISFTSVIYYGSSRSLTITYAVPGGAPRSDAETRVGAAYADFCVISNGVDSGTVRVVAPAGFTFTFIAVKGTFTSVATGGSTTWTSGTITDNTNFWACFAGTNPAGYTSSTLASPSGRQISIQAWPEDAGWKDQVTADVTGAVGALEALIGRGLPGSGQVAVREVTSNSLGNYAGSFDTDAGVAYVAEDIQLGVVAHELAHAWFNGSLFGYPWLSEGSAGWAESMITKVACKDPGGPPSGVTANLNSWSFAGPRATKTELAAVTYQYDASCFVVSDLARAAGTSGTRAAITALLDGLIAYQSNGSQLKASSTKAGWREWLDAMDELGIAPAGGAGLTYAQDLLKRFGAGTATDLPLLLQRADARKAYHDLAPIVTDWALPEGLLRAMAEWRFTDAQALISTAKAPWSDVAAADHALPEAHVLAGPVKARFEGAKTAGDMTAVAVQAADQRSAAELVAAAKAKLAAPRDNVTKLGLTGKDLAALLVEAIRAVGAADAEAARVKAAAITTTLSDEAAAAETVVAASDKVDASNDILSTIGLIGTDLPAMVATGVAAVAAVDPSAATAAASTIDRVLSDAPQQGIIRLATVLVLVLLVAVAVMLLRRRAARQRRTTMGGPFGAVVIIDGVALPPVVALAGKVEPAPDGTGDSPGEEAG